MRRWRAALAAALVAATMPGMAQGVVYTFVAGPLIVAVGDVTDYTFTFTNLDPGQRIRCVEVLFPDEFWNLNPGAPQASNNRPWSASLLGQWVLVRANGGGGRLGTGQSVTFTVSALATTPGAYAFDNHVHLTSNCDDPNINGIPVPFTVLPGILPTPSPTPTPAPTVKPTPTPAPSATPAPTVRPTPHATPSGSNPTPTPSDTVTATATASPTPRESASPSSSAPATSPGGSGGGPEVRVAPLGGGSDGGATDDLGVGVDVLGLLENPFEWIVPGAPVALPGLLVIIFVALQAMGALAWIPAVRRMGDQDDRRRRPPPIASRGA